MQIAILGPLEVHHDDAVVPVSGARLQTLLATLAIAGGRPVGAAALVEALWAAAPPQDEANALQSLVSRLRRALGPSAAIRQQGSGYLLAIARDDVDALRFEALAADGAAALRRGDPAAASATLTEALRLWRGDAPVGLPDSETTRLLELRLAATGDRIAADLALGRQSELVPELERLVAAHPLAEQLTEQLMTALASSGRSSDALAAYDRLRERLADELGIDPSERLQQRQLAVLRGEVVAAEPAERAAGNLRASLTAFFGRDAEVSALRRALSEDRLVTVLGPGGAGKTRLATEAAADVRTVTGGEVWVVELAPVTDPAEVPPAVLAQLGHRDQRLLEARLTTVPREAVDQLLQILRARRCLLVLDNCEHLLDAVAELADTLLARCPRLTVLATSREPLGITGEHLVPLPPLPMPSADASVEQALDSPAVRLFADRAGAASPGFAVDEATVGDVVQIVRRLDGLPLAIELAAARLRTLPVAEIAGRLSDRFRLLTGGSRTALPRHRTLRAVVQWSWDLLSPAEQTLADRLAVFPGGISVDGASAVAESAGDVADMLSALVDKSLLQLVATDGGGVRYRMLETIREFGTERLDERGELAGVRRAHAGYFIEMVARTEPMLRDRRQLAALRELDREHDNVLAAVRTVIDDGDAEAAVRTTVNLCSYWFIQDRHAEAATWFEQALAVPGEVPRPLWLTARAAWGLNSMSAMETAGVSPPADDPRDELRAIADDLVSEEPDSPVYQALLAPILFFFLGDHERASTVMTAATKHSDPWVRASGHSFRARFAENNGDLAALRADCAAALAGFEEIGDQWGVANILPLLSSQRMYDGDLDGAEKALLEGREIHRQFASSDSGDELYALLRLADLDVRRGNTDRAERNAADAVRLATSQGGPEMLAIALCRTASVALARDDLAAAVADRDRAAGLLVQMHGKTAWGTHHGNALVAQIGALIALRAGDADGARMLLRDGLVAGRASRDMPIMAMVGVGVADYALHRDDPVGCARLLGAGARLRGADDPTDIDVARLSAASRKALGQKAYDAAWREGQELSRDAAMDLLDAAVAG